MRRKSTNLLRKDDLTAEVSVHFGVGVRLSRAKALSKVLFLCLVWVAPIRVEYHMSMRNHMPSLESHIPCPSIFDATKEHQRPEEGRCDRGEVVHNAYNSVSSLMFLTCAEDQSYWVARVAVPVQLSQ